MNESKHEWRSIRKIFGRNYYEQRHESYICMRCGLRAGSVYESHRRGWVDSKNFDKPCKRDDPQMVLV